MLPSLLLLAVQVLIISTVSSTPIEPAWSPASRTAYSPRQVSQRQQEEFHHTSIFLEPGYPTIDLHVGPSLKRVRVLCDSGSSALWINAHHLGAYALSQLPISNEPMQQDYGAGSSSGIVATGHVTFAGFDNANVKFGLGTKMDQNPAKLGGIMGLARSSATDSFPSLMNQANKLMQHRVVGLALRRSYSTTWNSGNADSNELAGSISFGAVDGSQYEGRITYTTPINSTFWIVVVDDLAFDGQYFGIKGASAILDSGSAYTFQMSVPAARALHASIGGHVSAIDGSGTESYVFPCSSRSNVQSGFDILIGGQSYFISWESYNLGNSNENPDWCDSAITGSGEDESDPWLAGSVLFENVYAVFDWDGDQVGLAPRKRS